MKLKQLPEMPRGVHIRYEYTFVYEITLNEEKRLVWESRNYMEWDNIVSHRLHGEFGVAENAKIMFLKRYHNNFDRNDTYLSTNLIKMLNTNEKLKERGLWKFPTDEEIWIATRYLHRVTSKLKTEHLLLYKKHIVQSLLKHAIIPNKKMHNDRFITRTVQAILEAIGEEYEPKARLTTQLNRIIGRDKDEILHELSADKNINRLAKKLEAYREVYGIRMELPQMRLAVLFLRFCNKCNLIRPELRENVKRIMSLMSEYYECNTPQYRYKDITEYTEKGCKKFLYDEIIKEQPRFWDFLND